MTKRFKVSTEFVVDAETQLDAENIVRESLKDIILSWYFIHTLRVLDSTDARPS